MLALGDLGPVGRPGLQRALADPHAVRYREVGDRDRALMLKAEALSLADHLDAYAG